MTTPTERSGDAAAGSLAGHPATRFDHAVAAEVVRRLRAAGCVFAEEEAAALLSTAGTADALADMLHQRVAGRPLEHVLGWVEFAGLRLSVVPGVFVPRRRTEYLVQRAVARTGPGVTVVDLCCGSGAIGAAILSATSAAAGGSGPGWATVRHASPPRLVAADIDPTAVACARTNVAGFGASVYLGDLFEALPGELRGRVDVLVANVPYVPTGEIRWLPPEARLYEPRHALDGGADGLDVLRRIAAGAPLWLTPPGTRPGGCLLIEASRAQAPIAADVMSGAGLAPEILESAELAATVVVGTYARRR
ncbi:putative protein N(5)-glutamine methyltransferase [Rhizomonospora bruguierae]|uniref:putative protein N(5)-glutamine methyltransferase n=1 Tax=Rhizomonospora bruguierae TaxID=1581705 RepID=UPI001BCAFC05|nr:putative protein N(5)-glutamine methyltransferase [Micromonospora sp. NBRC 107566]